MAGSRSLGTLSIDVIAKTGGFEAGMDRAARAADKRIRDLERKSRALGVGIGVAFGAVSAAVGIVVRNTMQAEKSMAQLDAILKSTGNAAGYTRDQLVDMARQMQQASTFGTNEIIEAQTRLLSYSGVVGENLPRAMQVIIDQSARLGMSLSQSAETIGRALESPQKAAAALAQQGFGAAFTKEVRATIDALVAAGREADAQILILEILEESYEGAARAARDTFGGSLKALHETLADLMTGGDGSLNGATRAVNDLINALNDPEVRQGFQKIVSGVFNVSAELTKAIPFIASFGREMSGLVRQLGTDAAFIVEAASAMGGALKQVLTLGIADGTIDEANASWERAFQTRAEIIEENKRRLANARNRADIDRMLANPTGTYNGPLLEGFAPATAKKTVDTSGLDLRTKAERDAAKKAADEEAKAAEQLQRSYESLMGTMHQRIALMGEESEVARVRYEIEHGSLKGLQQSLADLALARASEYDAALERYNLEREQEAERKRVADEYQRERDALENLTAGLREQVAWLMASTDARYAMTAAQMAGRTATEQEIADVEELLRLRDSLAEAERNWQDVGRSISDSLFDVTSGAKSATDALKDFFDNLNRQILRNITDDWANSITDALKGFAGKAGAGGGGGFWGSILGAFGFGGGRASGGGVSPFSAVEVNERGFEMATVRGRDYLLAGNSPVQITPNHQLGGRQMQQTNNFIVQGRIDRRTQDQIAQDVGRRASSASRRNG